MDPAPFPVNCYQRRRLIYLKQVREWGLTRIKTFVIFSRVLRGYCCLMCDPMCDDIRLHDHLWLWPHDHLAHAALHRGLGVLGTNKSVVERGKTSNQYGLRHVSRHWDRGLGERRGPQSTDCKSYAFIEFVVLNMSNHCLGTSALTAYWAIHLYNKTCRCDFNDF